jgi:hypothetical protein
MVGQGDTTAQEVLGKEQVQEERVNVQPMGTDVTEPFKPAPPDITMPQPVFKEENKFKLTDLVRSIYQETSPDDVVYRALTSPGFEKDSEFDIKNHLDYISDLSFEEKKWLSENSYSLDEMLYRLETVDRSRKNREVFSEYSIPSILATGLATALFQPSTYAIGIGQAKLAANLVKTSTAAWAGKMSAVGAGVGVAYETPQFLTNPNAQASDLMWAAGLGAIIDGGLSKFYLGRELPTSDVIEGGKKAADDFLVQNQPLNKTASPDVPTFDQSTGEILFSVAPLKNDYIDVGTLNLDEFSSLAKGEEFSVEKITKVFNTAKPKDWLKGSTRNALDVATPQTNQMFKNLETSLNSTLESLNLPKLNGMFVNSRVKNSYGSYNANGHYIQISSETLKRIDDYFVSGKKNKQDLVKAVETISHELGHAVVMSTTAAIGKGKLSGDLQKLLRQAHSEWLESIKDSPTSFRQPASKFELEVETPRKIDEAYYTGFDEWAADSIAKYLMSNGKILENNLPKSFADKVLNAIKEIYKKLFTEFGLTNKDYNANIDQYMRYLGENYNGKITNFVSSSLPENILKDIALAGSKYGYKTTKDKPEDIAAYELTMSEGFNVVKQIFEPRTAPNKELSEEQIRKALSNLEAEKIHETGWQKTIRKLADKLDYTFHGRLKRRYKNNIYIDYAASFLTSSANGIHQRGMDADSLKFNYSHLFSSKLVTTLQDNYNNWAVRSKKINRHIAENLELNRKEFDEEVFQVMETKYMKWEESTPEEFKTWWDGYKDSIDPSVAKATEDLDEGFKEVLDELKKANVKGFENLDTHPGYIPHILNYDAILATPPDNLKYYSQIISKQFESLYGISKDKADKFAKNFLTNAVRRPMGQQADLTQVLTRGDLEDIKELFQGVDIEDIEQFIKIREERLDQMGRSSRAKKRIKFDLNDFVEGDDGVIYKLSDLYDKRLGLVNAKYSLEMSGHIGLGKHGIMSRGDFESFKARAMDTHFANGDTDFSPKQLGEDLDDLYNILMSRPIKDAMNKGVRRFNEYSNLILFGKSGIPQLAEMGAAIGHLGVGQILSASSDFKSLIRNMETGKVDNKTLAFLETLSGRIGEDHRLFPPVIERIGEANETGSNKFWSGVDEFLGKANKTLWNVNLNNIIRSAEQKVVAVASVQDVLDKLKNYNNLSNSKKIRLRSHGIGDKELNMFLRNIDKVEFSPRGGVIDANLDLWDNEAAQMFAFVIRKMNSNIIQGHMGTETLPIMYGNVGSLLTKARAYPIIALQKQLARNLYYGDYQAVAYFMYASMFGGLAYLGMVSANSFGREDWQEYIKERVQGGKILAGASMYTSYSSLFPDAMNLFGAAGMMPMQYTPTGIYMDRSGMSSSLTSDAMLNSIPAGGIAKNMINAMTVVPRWALGEDIPTDTVRSVKGSLAFGNWYGLNPLFNMANDYLK